MSARLPLRVLFVFVAALSASFTADAQELTGTFYGKVTAEDGALLPGVTVTVSSPQLIKGTEVRVSNEKGVYRVPALPPGVYSVEAELQGFQTVRRADISLTAGAVLAVDFKMVVAGVEETITVVGESPLVDVKSSQTTRAIDRSALENVPIGRSYGDLVTTIPGVVDSGYVFQSSQVVLGSSPRDNMFNVDGAVANDGVNNYMSMDIPYDMLEEVQVTTSGISAEFGQASGAVFNFITRSGGNSLDGSVSFFGQGKSLESDNLTDELIAQGLTKGSSVIRNLEYSFTAGGPVKKDHVWFFGNLRLLELETSKPDFPAANPLVKDRQAFAKVTSQVLSNTHAQASFTYRTTDEFPSNGEFRTNGAPETWSRSFKDQSIYNVRLLQVLGAGTLVEGSFGTTLVDLDSEFALDAVGYQDIVTLLYSGGWTGTSGKTFKRDKRNIKLNLSHFRDWFLGGSHNVKVGFYTELSPFARVRDIYGDTFLLLQNGAPYRVRLYNTPRTPATNVTTYAWFVQDEWSIRNRVTVNAGVRLESTEGWQPEQESGGGRWFPVEHFPEQRNQIKWFNAAPRLGVVWDVRGDKRTSVKVSYGRYYNALGNQQVLAANRGQAGYQEFDWIDRNGDRVFQNGEQATLRRTIVASQDDFDPNLKQPYVDAIAAGIERQLGSRFVVSVTGIYKHERDIMETVDIGRPFSGYNPVSVVNPLTNQPITVYVLDRAYLGVQAINLLTTPTDPVKLYRKYYGFEVTARRRMSDRWQFQGSVNVGRSKGTIGNSFNSSSGLSGLYNDPNSLVNAEGPLDMDTPLQVRLQGTYEAPHGIIVGAFYNGVSGFPIAPQREVGFATLGLGAYTLRYTRTEIPSMVVESFVEVAGEPRGTHRFDFRHLLSFRVEKQQSFGRFKLRLMADVFNALNVSTVTAIQTLQYGHANFLKPATIERPRALRVGVRFGF